MYVIANHQRYGWITDGQTDAQTTSDRNTALCVASRGKNVHKQGTGIKPVENCENTKTVTHALRRVFYCS